MCRVCEKEKERERSTTVLQNMVICSVYRIYSEEKRLFKSEHLKLQVSALYFPTFLCDINIFDDIHIDNHVLNALNILD